MEVDGLRGSMYHLSVRYAVHSPSVFRVQDSDCNYYYQHRVVEDAGYIGHTAHTTGYYPKAAIPRATAGETKEMNER